MKNKGALGPFNNNKFFQQKVQRYALLCFSTGLYTDDDQNVMTGNFQLSNTEQISQINKEKKEYKMHINHRILRNNFLI